MREFKLTKGEKDIYLYLPNEMSEITPEYLNDIASSIIPSSHYSVIALLYRDKLPNVLSSVKKAQQITSAVVPVFIKKSDFDKDEFASTAKCGDRISVTGSDLSMAIHVSSPKNAISISSAMNLLVDETDIYKQSLLDPKPVIFVELKLIPNNAIKAILSKIENLDSETPFLKSSPVDTEA